MADNGFSYEDAVGAPPPAAQGFSYEDAVGTSPAASPSSPSFASDVSRDAIKELQDPNGGAFGQAMGIVGDVGGEAIKHVPGVVPAAQAVSGAMHSGAQSVANAIDNPTTEEIANSAGNAVNAVGDYIDQSPNLKSFLGGAKRIASGMGTLTGVGDAAAMGPSIIDAAGNTGKFIKNAAEDLRSEAGPLKPPQQLNQDLGLNVQPGKATDIHQQVQTGVDNAINSATTDISGGKKFDPMQATVAASDRYHGLQSDIETNLRPALLSSAEGVSADASGLKSKLQKTLDFLQGTPDEDGKLVGGNAVPGTSSYAAIRPLKNILTRISENNGEIPFSDLLDLRKNVNELYSPGFGSSGKGIIGDYASGVRGLVKSTADDAMHYGNLDLADNLRQYDQRYADIGEAYKSDTAQKFVDSDAHEAVSRMNNDGTKPGVDVQAKAEGMIDNIKRPTDLVALKNQMPPEQYNAIRAEKLSQIISQAKDPNTGNYDLSKLQTILNPKNVVSPTARNQTALIQSLVEGNPQAQQALRNVQKLSDNLTKRGLQHNPDLTEPGMLDKAGKLVGQAVNASSVGLAKPAIKYLTGLSEEKAATPQYQILKNFAKDAQVKGQTPIPSQVKTPTSFSGRQPTISSAIPQPAQYSTSGEAAMNGQVSWPTIGPLSPEARGAYYTQKYGQSDMGRFVAQNPGAPVGLSNVPQTEYTIAQSNKILNDALNEKIFRPQEVDAFKKLSPADQTHALDTLLQGSVERSQIAPDKLSDFGKKMRDAALNPGEKFARGGAVNKQPTEKMIAAGNYKKSHLRIHGLDISIENPKGSVRTGTGKDGKEWESPPMPAAYGYIKGTVGADSDHVDCFIGDNAKSKRVYVIDQKNDSGSFDEHKVVFNATDRDEAVRLYKGSFSDKKNRIMKVTRLTIPEFKAWLKNGNTKQPMKRAA